MNENKMCADCHRPMQPVQCEFYTKLRQVSYSINSDEWDSFRYSHRDEAEKVKEHSTGNFLLCNGCFYKHFRPKTSLNLKEFQVLDG